MSIYPKMIMIVGIPASGKSTYAQELAKTNNAKIYSSDAIREELSGDINNQNINELVFNTLHNRIKEDLILGQNCIYDATNISYKRRMGFLQSLNKIVCHKVCVIMATPYSQCSMNNSKRERKVPSEVLFKMYLHFDIPYYYEGWDDIHIHYWDKSEYCYGSPAIMMDSLKNYNQYNSHHSLSLGHHCEKTLQGLSSRGYDLFFAGMMHDFGKVPSQTFEEDGMTAHYYMHEHCGSYDSLFYDTYPCDKLYVATLIRWHMQLYFIEGDEKAINKYKKLWGKDLYEDIMLLYKADKKAH